MKNKLFLPFVTLAAAVSCFAISKAEPIKASADNNNFTTAYNFEEYYDRNSTIDIPDGYFGDVKAVPYIYFPSGNVSIANSVKLTEQGNYVVKYIAEINNKTYMKDAQFKVKNPLLTFSGKNSTSKYTELNAVTKRAGLDISLAQGEEVTFNEPINLNNFNDKNPPFMFTIAPTKEGTFDAGYMMMTFTDVYNSNNSVTIKMNLNEDPVYTCWQPALGKANNQAYKGWNYSGSEPRLWVNNYGTYCEISPYNTVTSGTRTIENVLTKQKFGMWIDTNTNELFFCYFSFLSNMKCSAMMIDLDDGSYQEEIFPGFATGEVYVSLKAGNYQAPEFNAQILNLGDADLSKKYLDDLSAPNIVLEEEYTDDEIGVVGCSFPVKRATVYDGYCGYINPKVNVYYEYDRKNGEYFDKSTNYQKEIAIVNDRFETPVTGKYSIVYSAEDYAKNYVERVVNVNVGTTKYPIGNIVLSSGYPTSGEVNNKYALPDIISYDGGYGEVSTEYEITCNGEKFAALGDEVNGYYFIPRVSGEFSISVVAKDILFEKGKETYTFTVANQTNAAFSEDVNLPKYLIKSANYVLPQYQGQTIAGEYETASMKVSDGSGTRQVALDSKVQFTPDASGNATITYYFGTNERSYVIPVIDVKENNKIQIERYFICDNFDPIADATGVLLSSLTDNSFEFINPLLTNVFKYKFAFTTNDLLESRVDFTLVDSVNKKEAITFGFENNEGVIDLYFNGTLVLHGFVVDNLSTNDVTVTFNYETNILQVGASTTLVVNKTMYGEEFTGFSSHKVYLSGNLDGQCSITMNSIINQDLTSVSQTDNRSPSMYINGNYTTLLYSLNSVVDIYDVIGGDVLSPYTSCVLSLEYNYTKVTSTTGITLDGVDCSLGHSYQVKLTEFGTYTLTYVVTDWSNKRYTYSLLLVVQDLVAPDIYMDGEMPTTASVGTVTIPHIVAKDDVSSNCTLFITVFTPNNGLIMVTGNSFEALTAGTYILTITAFDDFGNTTYRIYYIEVK